MFSVKTTLVSPMLPLKNSSAVFSPSAISRAVLLFLISGETWDFIPAAAVPSLLEYLKAWTLQNPASHMTSRLSEKFSSVSPGKPAIISVVIPVSYTHLRAHETRHDLVCRLLLEKTK